MLLLLFFFGGGPVEEPHLKGVFPLRSQWADAPFDGWETDLRVGHSSGPAGPGGGLSGSDWKSWNHGTIHYSKVCWWLLLLLFLLLLLLLFLFSFKLLVICLLPLRLVAAAGVKGAGEGGAVVGSSSGGSRGGGSVRRSSSSGSSSSINRFATIVILGYLGYYSTAAIEYRIYILGLC